MLQPPFFPEIRRFCSAKKFRSSTRSPVSLALFYRFRILIEDVKRQNWGMGPDLSYPFFSPSPAFSPAGLKAESGFHFSLRRAKAPSPLASPGLLPPRLIGRSHAFKFWLGVRLSMYLSEEEIPHHRP